MVSYSSVNVLFTTLTVLFGLGNTQARFDDAGEAIKSMQLQRLHMPGVLQHLFSAPLLEHPHCKVECNGEEQKVTKEDTATGSAEEVFSCWGKSHTKCDIPQPGSSVKFSYSCNGAFLYKPITTSEDTHVKALHCEGATVAITEIQGEIIPDSGIECPGTCAFGTFCAVDSILATADKKGSNETTIRCQGILIDGSAIKIQSPPSSQQPDANSRTLQATPDYQSALQSAAMPRRSLPLRSDTPSATQVLESKLLAASRSSLPAAEPSNAPVLTPKSSSASVSGTPNPPLPQVDMEDMHVLGGRSHMSFFKEHGYTGSMLISKGLSTVHERVTSTNQSNMLELGNRK